MRHATQEDINAIEGIADRIGLCMAELTRRLTAIGTPVAIEALQTWVSHIDVAISNATEQAHLDQKTLGDTLADLAGERRRPLRVRP